MSNPLKWTDISAGKTNNIFNAKLGGSEITIWRHLHETRWSMDCHDLGISGRYLNASSVEEVKNEALDILKEQSKRNQAKLSLILEDLRKY